ncbi:MAG: hypothetical protein K2N58_03735 [Treponemataceae bacterium]|nr:hypothetical protein [Treponemataceae bacterium]
MKKTISAFVSAAVLTLSVSAYNPPVQGENLFYLSHPESLTGGISTAGGGILSATPASTSVNPALGALESRITLDAGYTMMFDSVGSRKYGQAFELGILVPTDWASFSAEIEGAFVPFWNMQLGNNLNFKSTVSKQILDNLHVGIGILVGGFWGYNTDWMLAANIGAIYNFGDIAFLKNFRIGASLNNVGKLYHNANVAGINSSGWNNWPSYPTFMTIRAGAAAELVHIENFVIGLSLDVTTPLFQNFILDSGLQIEIAHFVQINTSWHFNAAETSRGRSSWLPTVGLIFKFNIGTGFLNKEDWSQSEISPSAAWKNVDRDINLFSAGAVVRLGELDTSGPDIEIE